MKDVGWIKEFIALNPKRMEKAGIKEVIKKEEEKKIPDEIKIQPK